MDYRLRRHDGMYRWVLDHGTPRYTSDGRFLGFIGSCIDIHERKIAEIRQQFLSQASNALASSLDYEKTLATITELAVPVIADWCTADILTEDGQIQRLSVAPAASPRMALVKQVQTQYPTNINSPGGSAKVIRTGQSDFLPHISEAMVEAAARDPEHLEMLRQFGFRSSMVVPMTARGRTFGAMTFVATDESGRLFDTQDLHLAEELGHRAALAVDNARLYRQAQLDHQRLQVTLMSVGDGMIATDAEGKITFMNVVAETLTHWQQEEAIGLHLDQVFQIVNQNTREKVESPAAKVLREGVIVGLANHTILINKSGQEIAIDDSGAPIFDEQGQLLGVVLVFRDIRERYQLEKEREQVLLREHEARLEAEKANRLKLLFLGTVSHELRTPLTSIKGFTSTLLAKDIVWTADQYQEFVGIIDDEANKLKDLVDQLLDFSSLQVGTLSVKLQPEDFRAIIKSSHAQLQAITRGHSFVIEASEDLPLILADQQRIAQTLVNLVDNAAKYSPPGTHIRLRVQQTGDWVQIDVIDQGPGIPLDEQVTVFEAFRQAENRVRKSQRGAGLGLAICKGLVEAHGGRIWIDNVHGAGTMISFTLPIATENAI